MFYIPPEKYFKVEEFFSPDIVQNHIDDHGNLDVQIWRLMDSRILWTATQLRKLFGTMYINDYLWDGRNKNRGYRDPISLIDQDHYKKTGAIVASWSSFTSQHCLGNALDSSFKNHLAQEVRSYIIANKEKDSFKYITAIEKEVQWVHCDCRNFKNGDDRFFIF